MRRRCGLRFPAPAPFLRRCRAGRRRVCFFALSLVFLTVGARSAPARGTAGATEVDTEARSVAIGSPETASKGRLLVASRDLLDPDFAETVVLVLESGPD